VKFKITQQIFEKFPDLSIGTVTARDVDNRGRSEEIIASIREREKEIRQILTAETLSQQPRIGAWRRAYSLFGAKPIKYKSSVEGLYRMILKGMELRPINKIVDIYNFVSIKHMIPVGGDDLKKVEDDITLTLARGGEPGVFILNQEGTEIEL